MAKATSENQEILGNYWKCCSDSNLRCYVHLLFSGNRPKRHATWQKYIWGFADP